MIRINPTDFIGPRAYFTNFDNRVVKAHPDLPSFRKEIERKLKILILTKSTVTCAAAHLTSEFVYEIFADNPVLLAREVVTPALRNQCNDISELFDRKDYGSIQRKNEIIGFYKNYIHSVVGWDVVDNINWFKTCFASEVNNQKSVLRQNLEGISKEELDFLINTANRDDFAIELVQELADRQPIREHKKVLKNFRELYYHFSGARIINCESNLAQENYIDYSLADIERREIKLSEVQIFWKIFMELAFETMKFQSIPIELLDRLSFDRVVQIRDMIDQTTFKTQYEMLIQKSVNIVNVDETDLVIRNLEEINAIREKIAISFQDVFKSELGQFLKKQQYKDTKSLASSAVSVGLGLTGLIPGVAPLTATTTGIISLMKDGRELFINMNQNYDNHTQLKEVTKYRNKKNEIINNTIKNSDIQEKSVCLDIVEMLSKTISETLHFGIK